LSVTLKSVDVSNYTLEENYRWTNSTDRS